jgi:hypothetical protein
VIDSDASDALPKLRPKEQAVAEPADFPVFVIGMNGSGTSMLLDSLGRHPELYAFPRETRLIPYLAARHKSLGDMQDDNNFRRMWEEVLSLDVFAPAVQSQQMKLPDDWRECQRSLAAILDAVMSGLAAAEGKSRWCEKSPQYAQQIVLLRQLFPDARFIHMIRDGRDCAVSFHRRWLRSPSLTIQRWKKLIAEARRQAQSIPAQQYMELRYEDLTTNPEAWLRDVCAFLQLPFDPVVLQSSQPYLRGGDATRGKDPREQKSYGAIRQNAGKWRSYFSMQQQRELESIAGRVLVECGYTTEQPDADYDLSKLRTRWLSFRDGVAQFGREVLLKLQGKIQRPWHVILAKPFNARKQRAQNKF